MVILSQAPTLGGGAETIPRGSTLQAKWKRGASVVRENKMQWNKLNYKITDLKRFWNKVQIPNNLNDCWEWIASTGSNDNYGRFGFNGTNVLTHRFVFECFNGTITDNQYVCHECDNQKCVNPNHLFLDTQKGNMKDMIHKGRGGLGNLIDDQIILLLEDISNGMILSEVEKKYNISVQYIRRILLGEYRTDITINYNLNELWDKTHKTLSEDVVRQIRDDIYNGKKRGYILQKYNIIRGVYDGIRTGKTYKNVK